MSYHKQDGNYAINSLLRLASDVPFALSCMTALYKLLFTQTHMFSASS